MKIAIVGSRQIKYLNLEHYLPPNITEIVSGGAIGVDTIAKRYAIRHNLKLTEFLPNYKLFGKRAPLIRNLSIIEHADKVIAFWDGYSRGTKFVIDNCKEKNIPIDIYLIN